MIVSPAARDASPLDQRGVRAGKLTNKHR